METVNAIGRRKSAIARIYVNEGKGKITVNDRAFEEYFPLQQTQNIIQQPLNLVEASNKYDIVVNLKGGGTTGQAEALRLALARAMVKINPESKEALKAVKLMTRDPREVERKKPGQPGARKRFQFSKR
ncbi:MAG: ribosomal protein [Bacteroidetes bacterium]|jgi:small subunit ribosomal protein S9|nr:ribosomal protein [Bacteroidota bacterium]MBS1234192.1 ribosomal protein [Bacteroidota bacterium]